MVDMNSDEKSLKSIILEAFNVLLPISGGNGNSFENAIVIEVNKPEEGIQLEYAILKYIHLLGNKEWKEEKQSKIEKDGKIYDKLQIVLTDDPDNYHNYYFDITSFSDKWIQKK